MPSDQSDIINTSPEKIGQYYSSTLLRFTKALEATINTSHAAAGLDGGQRRYWSSILLIRIGSISTSIFLLCPGNKANPEINHWDFASVGSLARNLFECCLFFIYFTENVEENEWKARLNVMRLHDCMERHRMFTDLGSEEEVLESFAAQATDLRSRLTSNPYFRTLPESAQKRLLKGERASIFTMNDTLEKLGLEQPDIWGHYRLLSSQTHSLPLGFYRTEEQNRRGEENDVDKGYIAGALDLSSDMLEIVVSRFQDDFKGLASFSHRDYNWSLLRSTRKAPDSGTVAGVGRNAICPCGSKKKFRWCHGLE